MSIQHQEFCELVERVTGGDPLSQHDRDMLEDYANLMREDDGVDDQLDRITREAVEDFTGSVNVWTPRLATQAMLSAAAYREHRAYFAKD